ncbi:hypothetical protein NP493_626g01025 [Ridgeia piscesae]|uniref:Reelin n=1 Tax=Ridgeia piscesae TaxID=27915 RepID=A0AAD9KT18_RIDPI|nr:hypothetical protein NP493_626g01025 [Ridgeia piscesae]
MDANPKKQYWALDDVYIGAACQDICHGHGHCDYPLCICDKGYGGHNCHQLTPIKTYLKDTFEPGHSSTDQWSLVQGGQVGVGCRTLVKGKALHFSGHGQRQAITTDLDLRNARFVQYYAMIGGPSTKKECGTPKSRNESVVLQYSTNAGITWHTMHVLDFSAYWSAPQRDYIPLPRGARTNSTRVRWWQALESDVQSHVGWTLDDVYIGGSKINPSELYENFDGKLDEELWESHPNGDVLSMVCQRKNTALAWGKQGGHVRGVTTRQLIVQSGHMLQFKIMVGCGLDPFRCTVDHGVELQYNKDPLVDDWEPVFPQCHINGHGVDMQCRPYQVRPGSVYTANSHPHWTRVSLMLPLKVFSSTTRFRWVQQDPNDSEIPDWAIDDIYIGEACPQQCQGRGDCVHGKCVCDPSYVGETCEPIRSQLLSHMTDGFEDDISPGRWVRVSGGSVGLGCGALLPQAHGKNLYFNGCGLRQAVTAELDLTRASKVMFVLKIGSVTQSESCNIDLNGGSSQGMVLLQYSKNKGIDWHLLATHDPHEFLTPRRVGYDIPRDARTYGIQFRWWQPEHRGTGKDQWAIDFVEVVMTRQDQMLRTENRYRAYHRRGFIPNRRLP